MKKQNKPDHPDKFEDIVPPPGIVPDRSFAQEISTATLVKLLVAKGVLSVSELLEEEKQSRSHPVPHQDQEQGEVHKNKWFRRWAARHRWSRRLTSTLFGWQWRKVKSPSAEKNEPSPADFPE